MNFSTSTRDEKGNIQTKKNPIAVNMIIDPQAKAVIDDILSPPQTTNEQMAALEDDADEALDDAGEQQTG